MERTRIGSSTPFSRMDAASSSRLPGLVRGCSGLASISSSGIIEPMCRPDRRVSSSTKCASWRMLARSGSPRFMAISYPRQDLFGQRVVLHRPARARREREDRLLVRRALLEPDRLRDHWVQQPLAVGLAYRLVYVGRRGVASAV